MRYSSDLTDEQWNAIKHLVGRPDPRGARSVYERREIINAILYLNKTGCQWRMIPIHFPKWQNVYNHFSRMRQRGVWKEVCMQLNELTRIIMGRTPTPSYLLIDSQSVKTNYEGEERGFHGGKKVKGRSRQITVDTQGNLWSAHVHSANKSDTVEGCVLMDLTVGDLPSVSAVCADQGYRGTFVNAMKEDWNMDVHITARKGKGFVLDLKRWVVERTFGWFNGRRRLSKDYEKLTKNSEAMLYIAAIARSFRNPLFN